MTKKSITVVLILTAFTAVVFFTGCTKEVPKELLNKQQEQPMGNQQQMPNDSIHRNLTQPDPHGNMSGETGDSKEVVEKLTKEADDADAKFQKTKSEADKKVCVEKQMAAANFLMFEADLAPKQKYRPALKRYNRVLELDPSNREAAANKKQIEDIYQQMGMPIPN